MIKVSAFYPTTPGKRFDMGYFVDTHVPLAQKLMGAALKQITVDEGLSGGDPGSQPPFVAVVHMLFDSAESFQQVFGAHAAAIMGDVPNYTDIAPVLQINAIRKS